MHLHLWQSIPFACIILPLGAAAVTSVMKPRMARIWATSLISIVTVLSAIVTVIFMNGAEPYTYMMGHYPAPWGNEIKAGMLEALTALGYSSVEAREALAQIHTKSDQAEELIRLALRAMAGA